MCTKHSARVFVALVIRDAKRMRHIILIQGVPLATEPGISLIISPLMRILQRNLKRTTDTFLFISHTTNVLLFKFRCNIFIGVRSIKEMPGSVASGTHCVCVCVCVYIYMCVCVYIYIYVCVCVSTVYEYHLNQNL